MPPKRRAHKHDANTSGSAKKVKSLNSEDVLSTAAQKNLSNDDYTVGWISAITTEYVAAQSFLDAEHDRPEYVAPNDSNDYTLGRMGQHNVVIAVLPKGEYGIASAATVAIHMLHSFKNVKIGFMVGIGGGAPNSKHDIRLGDIVVSTPFNKEGGVLQYTFGKANQGRKFEITGHLNQPPVVLRTAVSGLEAQYELRGHQFEETINDILENNPRLKNKYKRPDPNTDRLYLSAVKHPAKVSKANCDETCGSDVSKLVPRDPRDPNENIPAIYYGIIASADIMMKDALLRDKIAEEHDVLCFEMEAAGLMNSFPCLVIRGICDYSDSHKNKEWQGYAAMAAAAYAKDLLGRVPLSKVKAEKRIIDVLSSG